MFLYVTLCNDTKFSWRGKSRDEEFTDLRLCIPGETQVAFLSEYIGGSWGIDPTCVSFYINDEGDGITEATHGDKCLADLPLMRDGGEVFVTVRLHRAEWHTRNLIWIIVSENGECHDLRYDDHVQRCWGCGKEPSFDEGSSCIELACGHTHCGRCANSIRSEAVHDDACIVTCMYCQLQHVALHQDGPAARRTCCDFRECDRPPTQRCWCEVLLCDEHAALHSGQLRDHATRPIRGLSDAAPLCLRHDAEHVRSRHRLYCTVLKEALCGHCDYDGKHASCGAGAHIPVGSAAAVKDRATVVRERLRDAVELMEADQDNEDGDDASVLPSSTGDTCPRSLTEIRDALVALAKDAVSFMCGVIAELPPSAEALRHGARIAFLGTNARNAEGAIRKWIIDLVNADVNKASAVDGSTAMHFAARLGQPEVVRFLRETFAADVTKCDAEGLTPLHEAARCGHGDTAHLLLQYGADIEACSKAGFTPLHLAAQSGQFALVMSLHVDFDADVVSPAGSEGVTALHLAAGGGHTPVVQFLCEIGLHPNIPTRNGATAMHFAAEKGHVGVGALLYAIGAKVKVATRSGSSPLRLAAENGHTAFVHLLQSVGANVSETNVDGQTLLQSAADRGWWPVVECLLAAGVDMTKCNDVSGNSPLHSACRFGSALVVATLARAGADIHLRNKKGWMPIHFAAKCGHAVVVQYLVCLGADVNATTSDRWAPLHFACYNGHLEVVEFLCNLGVPVDDTCSTDGYTALHLACQEGKLPIVQFLLRLGADPNLLTTQGATVQALAKAHPAVVQYLQQEEQRTKIA